MEVDVELVGSKQNDNRQQYFPSGFHVVLDGVGQHVE